MNIEEKLLDPLTEVVNIGIGKAAHILNTMLDSHIKLSVPVVKIFTPNEIKKELQTHCQDKLSIVNLPFNGDVSGNARFLIPTESASSLVTVFTNEADDYSDLDSIRSGALVEIGNVVLNGLMGSISNLLKFNFTYTVPDFHEGTISEFLHISAEWNQMTIIYVKANFKVMELNTNGEIVLLFEVGSLEKLLIALESNNSYFSGESK